MNIKQVADNLIKQVQNGDCPSRDIIPKNMRGRVAETLWNDSTFTYGIEYGVILGMLILKDLKND